MKPHAALVLRRRGDVMFEYLLQHRSPGVYAGAPERGAGMLGLPGGRAAAADRGAVETAWREAVEEGALGAGVPLAAVVRAVVHTFFVPPCHTVVIADAEHLACGGKSSDEVATHVWPSGHVWVTEAQLEDVLRSGGALRGVALWPAVAGTLRAYRPALGHCSGTLLYHGTTVAAALSILEQGFRTGGGMLGPGVYMAQQDKASSNAGRAAGEEKSGADILVGAVLECHVRTGLTWVADVRKACTCGCRRLGVDHVGTWQHAADTLFLPGGGPSAKRPEWCVRNPNHITPLRYCLVYWTRDRQQLDVITKWFY